MDPYHEGEHRVQQQAGVAGAAAKVGRIIRRTLPAAAAEFLGERSLLIVGSVRADGRMVASLLDGPPGFARSRDAATVEIDARAVRDGTLAEQVAGAPQPVGLLAIDLTTRRRMRANGVATVESGGVIVVRIDEAYSNCPKYIQRRELKDGEDARGATSATQKLNTSQLSPTQIRLIDESDTFFIASRHPKRGADVSHRGGKPGFLRVLNPTLLAWPDYPGNNMFQTLGNITVEPQVGLLVIDWEHGTTLQVTGTAQVIWHAPRAAEFAGAERVVEMEISEVTETRRATPLRWRFVEASPSNP